MKLQAAALTSLLCLALVAPGQSHPSSASTPSAHSATATGAKPVSVYAPYEPLIGEWEVAAEGGPAVAITTFRWGTGRSYIWFTTSLVNNGAEVPHFEGMLMWNGVHKNLDMLVTLDLEGGRSQEQGDFYIEPDGTFVRRITAYFSEGLPSSSGKAVGPEGSSAKFRQTFKSQGPNTMITSVMRETSTGWVPSFPGSEKLVMKRRPANSPS